MERKSYADVWGDTVDLRHLAIAMIIGIAISLTCYILGLKYITANFPKVAANLKTAYALLIGIGGCLVSAVISAKLFAPKRTLKEDHFSLEDREAVLAELQVDRAREAEEIKTVPPRIAMEMKELQLYDLFADYGGKKKAGE